MRKLAFLSATALLAIGSGPAVAQDIAGQPAEAWVIGPIIRGKNYSVQMPLHPEAARRGWSFEFPYPDARAGHVHYVTTRLGSLQGRSRMIMRYRIDAAPGARFVAQANPDYPATVSLFFQRIGDSWSGRRHPYHRWWSPSATMRELDPGEHEISVSLDDPNWISVFGAPASSNPQAFAAALAETDRVGVVFGSPAGRGHGVYATRPARFTLISFRIL